MSPRKPKPPKPNEPSLRDKLSENFLRAFESDFENHGVEAIEQLRQKSPEKYSEIAARLIAVIEPKSNGFEQCNTHEEIGRKLLENAGMPPDAITSEMIEQAIEAQNALVQRIDEITQAAGYHQDLY